ncbi:MAG: glycosyltransferase [Planctomycetota bacterium]|jgi:cellulose synthase/poly-beta-1,6-N-acetylglucosamine synthase-like glycosyltransferase
MSFVVFANLCVLGACLLLLGVFALYPIALWIVARSRPERELGDPDPPPVSMLVAVRNGQAHIGDKIRNALDLDYPRDRLEIIVHSDGSTDGTVRVMRQFEDSRVVCLESAEHIGKAEALNRAARACRGDIIVFSDADALLERGALRALVRHFDDPRLGGVCGQRVISRDGRALKAAQHRYIAFDSTIKTLESRFGRITSNDGKLYAVRRPLVQPITEGVTDDLFVCLTVIRQGFGFIFEPRARALIRLPSRSPSHEVERRRRIVSRSLRGIRLMRGLLNPWRYGAYAVGLMINKLLRRLLPVGLILILVSTAILSAFHPAAAVLLAVQAGFYAAALAYPALARIASAGAIRRAASVPFYFCVGNYGTLLGLADFLRGRRVARWDPRKTDGDEHRAGIHEMPPRACPEP